MASQAELDALRAGETTVPSSGEKPHEFDDAERQWKVLNPETLSYPLDVDGVRHEIVVKTEFSINDLFANGVLEDLGAFSKFVYLRLADLAPSGGEIADPAWLRENGRYAAVVFDEHDVKERLRRLLLKITRFAKPLRTRIGTDGRTGEPLFDTFERPTMAQLTLGMEPEHLTALATYMLGRYVHEVTKRKNARAAAGQSGSPPSSPSSRQRTTGPRRKSFAKR